MSLWSTIVRAEHSLARWLGFSVLPDPADDDDSAPTAPTTLGAAATPLALPVATTAAPPPTSGDDPIVGPAFPWLAKWTPDDRRALLEAQTAVGLDPKIGGLLAVIDHESGGNPAALNPLPAAGLIQLTKGANLPGFGTPEAVRDVATWSPVRQLREIVIPFYRRMFPHGAAATQSGTALLRKNFLPAIAGESGSFVLAVNPGSMGPNGETSESTVSGLSRGAIYKSSYGFDPGAKMVNGMIAGGRGYFTWADADKHAAASVARGASRGWMRVSGAVQPASDPAMAGVQSALYGCVIPTRRRHGHTCSACGHSWWHDPEPCIGFNATNESCEIAHVCPACGHVERRVDLALCEAEPAGPTGPPGMVPVPARSGGFRYVTPEEALAAAASKHPRGGWDLRNAMLEDDPTMRGAATTAELDPIQWIEIDAPGGYRVKTTAEPLSVGGVRLPMSFGDLIRYAAANNALPLTKAISQARWEQAIDRRLTAPVQSKDGAHFNDAAQNATFAATLGPVGHVLRDGGWKEMIVDPSVPLTKTGPNSMVFFGWRKPDGSTIQQGISSHHDRKWIEYDSFGSLVSRDGTLNGQPVDLLAEIAKGGPLGGPLAPWLVAELSGAASAAPGPLASSSVLSEWSTA